MTATKSFQTLLSVSFTHGCGLSIAEHFYILFHTALFTVYFLSSIR